MYPLNAGGADYWLVATKINGDFKLLLILDSSASSNCPDLVNSKFVRYGATTNDLSSDNDMTITSI